MVGDWTTGPEEASDGMQIKTILNRVQRYSGFVYGEAVFVPQPRGPVALEIGVRPHGRNRPRCSGCGHRGPGYDTREVRRFEFVPLWGIPVFLVYLMRRVDCAACGVRVERVPWAEGKRTLTTPYAWFLARWARLLSWQDVARTFHTSWDQVFRAVTLAVTWGLAHRDLTGVAAVGVDEIQWQHGHRYLTVVYQLDGVPKRLLWIGRDRRVKTLLRFFRWWGRERSAALRFVCSDLWKPYLKVVRKKAGHALHVLDRFHIAKHFGDAIEAIRRAEVHDLRRQGRQPLLTKTRWLLLKRRDHRTVEERGRLRDLVRYNLKAVRATLLREDFEPFWHYRSPTWAGKFLDAWVRRALASRLEPMQTVARMLRRHRDLLLNWFRAKGQLSTGAVEGLNNKAKLTTRKAYGFRSYRCLEIALYHTLGDLPEPKVTHRFC
jgi:transposase